MALVAQKALLGVIGTRCDAFPASLNEFVALAALADAKSAVHKSAAALTVPIGRVI